MANIKLKVQEVRAMHENMGLLTNDQTTGQLMRWPTKIAYWISRVSIKLQGEYETSEKARVAAAEEFGTRTEDGQRFEFPGDAAEKFSAAMKELMDTEIEVDLMQIGLDQFDGREISPAIFVVFDKLITEA